LPRVPLPGRRDHLLEETPTPHMRQALTGRAQSRVFGLLGTLIGAGLAFGPQLSGLALQTLGWRAIFVLPAAVCAIALVLLLTSPASSQANPPAAPFDWAGAVLFTTASLVGVTSLVELPQSDTRHPVALMGGVPLLALVATFVWAERRTAHPVMDFALLRNRNYSAIAVAGSAVMIVLELDP
ncbi:MFS transporter, partial [Frankia sp. R82]|uniref:MFS transporter n=1 Tax=Frankia sp. R82 TaxID=2950553 RepID=UPI00204418C1